MVKSTGMEWKKFYFDEEYWPNGAWHEDAEIKLDGNVCSDEVDFMEIADSSVITLSGGVFYPEIHENPLPLELHFKRWRKKQKTTVLLVEVPNELAVAVVNSIISSGGKVKK